MADDIVEVLRKGGHETDVHVCETCDGFCYRFEVCDCCWAALGSVRQAADEIERLRSVNEALLQANADLRDGLRRSGQTILDLAALCHRLLDEQANQLRQGDRHPTPPHPTDSTEQ